MRVKLTLAYDGAPFAGWQSQASGDGVQDVVEAALGRIAGGPVTLHGAGRTDAGVHARGQVAHFDAPGTTRLTPANWQRALNAHLPPTIRVLRAAPVAPDFHARFSATGKVYRYELWLGDVLPPHLHQRAWHLPHATDRAQLAETARLFEGTHDFRAFAANRGKPVPDTCRTIHSVRLRAQGPAVALTFVGTGFLYKMVRMLVGASVRVAQGRDPRTAVERLLASPNAGRWTHVAPADGLTLVRVRY